MANTLYKERVKKIMAGQVLEPEAKTIRNQGCAEKRSGGRPKGIRPVIIQMYRKGFTLSQIAAAADKEEEKTRQIIDKEQG